MERKRSGLIAFSILDTWVHSTCTSGYSITIHPACMHSAWSSGPSLQHLPVKTRFVKLPSKTKIRQVFSSLNAPQNSHSVGLNALTTRVYINNSGADCYLCRGKCEASETDAGQAGRWPHLSHNCQERQFSYGQYVKCLCFFCKIIIQYHRPVRSQLLYDLAHITAFRAIALLKSIAFFLSASRRMLGYISPARTNSSFRMAYDVRYYGNSAGEKKHP